MAHEVESMFYTREEPWHGLGTKVDECLDSAAAIRTAGLDWLVQPKPLYLEDGTEVEGYVANVRDVDSSVLGVVGKDYSVVQNHEAFAFTDALIGTGKVRYETAGSLAGGKRVWMLSHLKDSRLILGDKMDNYLCFSTSHDASAAVRVMITPIRVVCQNTLNMAVQGAKRAWSTKHMGNMSAKLKEAEATLMMVDKYLDVLEADAEVLSQFSLTREAVELILDGMFPTPALATDRILKNREQSKDEIIELCSTSDLRKFGKDNAWAFLNAVSDWSAHRQPLRRTATYDENNFENIVSGHPVFDQAYALVKGVMKNAA